MRKTLKTLLAASIAFVPLPVFAQTEITVWHMEQPPHRVERIQTLIDEFNAANPGIVVKQEPQNWGEVYTKAPAAVAAGNAPELLFAIPDFTPILKDLGTVQPMEDFVAEMDGQYKFYPAAVEPYTYDGGIPGPCRCRTWRSRSGTASQRL